MKVLAALVVSILAIAPAFAWELQTGKDRLTDKPITGALVRANPEPGRLIDANLHIVCSQVFGRPTLDLTLSPRLTPGQLGFRYVVDSGKPKLRNTRVGGSGNPLIFISNADEIAGAKRLRVELQPARIEPVMLEFDVSGYEKARAHVNCR